MSSRLSEFLAGCRDEAPLQLGVVPFGMLYGIGALAAGMPAEWDIDFAVPLTFIALLTLLMRERAGQAAALVAAVAALALAALPFRLGLVVAILLGLLAGVMAAKRSRP